MVFSSLIFVYLFFPLQMGLYYLVPKKYKNIILLLFSLIFYAWAGPVFLLLLTGEAFVSWFLAKKIQDDRVHAKRYFIIECILLLSLLGFFKYLAMLNDAVNAVLGLCSASPVEFIKVTLPVGISFYTFQLLSYVADVYKEKVEANRYFWKILLYAGLFHQCIAGPIVRYETVCREIDERSVSFDDIYKGLFRFCIGLSKKAVLANSCAKVADTIYAGGAAGIEGQTMTGLWLGAVFYTLQIYLDFSAYSDMAIGMGRMSGFHYLENFNYPYICRSVKDFWRRWHISLSTFFRDYVYIPLGGSRVKAARHILNLFIVWALTGLWHGASLNFIIWGLYYFVFLLFEKYILRDRQLKFLGHIYALPIVIVGWVIFKFDSFDEMLAALRGMAGLSNSAFCNLQTQTLLLSNIYLLVAAVLASTPLVRIVYLKMSAAENKIILFVKNTLELLVPPVLLAISTIALVGNSYNPFLYFRF